VAQDKGENEIKSGFEFFTAPSLRGGQPYFGWTAW